MDAKKGLKAMGIWTPGESEPEDPPYERLILRRVTYPRPDSPIYIVEDLVEDVFPLLNVPENFREKPEYEILEKMVWDLCTDINP